MLGAVTLSRTGLSLARTTVFSKMTGGIFFKKKQPRRKSDDL